MMRITSTLKLLLIGNSNVGKSSILLRFTDDSFLPQEETSATIGVDFKVKMMELEGKKYKLTIWDTAGQERFRTLTSSYYRGAQGVILVYDVTNRATFDQLDVWFKELDTYATHKEVVKMVVGNKVDKESDRVVSLEEGQSLAESRGALFCECSAKTRMGILTAMEQLVGKIIETPSLWQNAKRSGRSTRLVDPRASGNGDVGGSCSC
ncbi:P-loop containing nucleoside triphosphate hydrolase protein [Piptocephalis cylindrospora]|uniref:P-loop containing nucleoside triphosphate hydrolase protein n=1 Tax=Piptocephalis cylindrospora TaxID=1907219 RepID=A0A4P9YB91_9FUNG|nr:P-loop containing nucleoside triphosphate hydrolase protein [Piptocephalis cylindrospora]|eukprot:RKP15400.1 P-loop containing nucleoside triphosphate hydrolase protein [Piptocephalis cylindrospora]